MQGRFCVCVCVSTEWKQNWISLYVWICSKKRASIRMHVCLRACVSSASYVSMSHDQRVLLMLTKIRLLVIGSVNCSALLNYSRPGKGWGLPFSLSLSPSLMLAVFGLRDMKWKTDESPCVTAECVSLCRSPGRRMILISPRLFLSVCACIHVRAVHNIRRHRSGRCTVTCSLTGTLTQLSPYFPHRCLNLTLTYAIPCLSLFPNMNLIIFRKPSTEKQAPTRFFFGLEWGWLFSCF